MKYALGAQAQVHLALRNPDLTTAERIAAAIDHAHRRHARRRRSTRARSHWTCAATTWWPPWRASRNCGCSPIRPAVVVVEESSGTIVMGDNVRISTVAVAQGNLTVRVTETPEVSQPAPFSNGQTVVVPRTSVQVQDGSGKKMGVVPSAATLRDLVASLNALGVGPRDMISILQSIKAAGALQAELEIR